MSQPSEIERRLAAILAADVAGFSRLTEADEVGTMHLLAVQRSILDAAIARHRGRIANTAGDSVLAEFPSVVNAVQCAIEAQQALRNAAEGTPEDRRVLFRMGIHVGDVMVRSGDLLGGGVNVAARLESLAEAGGVVISAAAHEQVKKILPLAYTDLGPQQAKNINEPLRAFSIGSASAAETASLRGDGKPLPLPDKPSIAVLPLQNMSGDPEQQYFADGMVEDIITALSRFKSLFVIARNSSFAYKGKSPDIRQVGHDLGVRYVLEGSVRKAGRTLRISAQLIDASSGAHIWAERFDGSFEDVFALQDDVTEKVVVAIAPRVQQAEIAWVRRRSAGSADAYDCYLRGLACLYPVSGDSIEQALSLFTRATALDTDYASAYAMAMHCRANRLAVGLVKDMEQEKSEVRRLLQMVLRTGQDDGFALAHAAWAVAYVLRDLSAAKPLIDKAVQLNPNLASAWQNSGWIDIWLGNPEIALEHLLRAERLDPLSGLHLPAKAHACFFLGRYDEALEAAEQIFQRYPQSQPGLRIGIASAALARQTDTARRLAERFQRLDPSFRVSRLSEYLAPYRKAEFVQRYGDGLRLAGLPE